MASPLVRIPEPIKPHVMKLVQLYRLKLADDAIRAIDTARTFDEAVAPLQLLEASKEIAS